MQCELVSWEEVCRLSQDLAERIQESGFRPDLMVAIARGGFVPARLLCDALDLYELASLRIVHYEGGARKKPQARLCAPLSEEAHGLDVLVVDDCSDTGETLALAIEHLQRFAPQEIRVAVLHHKQVSAFVPEYYGEKIEIWRWLIYPWALTEDLSGFIAALAPRPDSWEEALRQLELRYGIKPPPQRVERIWAAIDRRAIPVNEV